MATNFDQHTCPVATSAFEGLLCAEPYVAEVCSGAPCARKPLAWCMVAFIRTPNQGWGDASWNPPEDGCVSGDFTPTKEKTCMTALQDCSVGCFPFTLV